MPRKLSRRQAIKALAAAGAVIAATPMLSKAFGTTQQASEMTREVSTSTEPLVIVVKGKELIGFRGLEEFRVADADLAYKLNSEFHAKGDRGLR